MAIIKIFNIDNNEYFNQELIYNDNFMEGTIPLNIIKYNVITDINQEDINDCLSILFEENKDAIYNQVSYSKENKILLIMASKELSQKKWISINKRKKIKVEIINDLIKILKSNNNNEIDFNKLITIQNNENLLKETITTLEESIKIIFPKATIKLLDYDKEYKDLFISIIINGQEYDFNIWPYDNELEIEDYTENNISIKLKEIILNNKYSLYNLYNNTKPIIKAKIKIKGTNLILWIDDTTITLTNNYENDYERILILEISDYIKYCTDKDISNIIKNNEDELLNKLSLSKENIKKITKD